MIDKFQGEYRFLSNFWNASVTFEGKEYLNSEAAFQSAKTLDSEVRDEFTRLNPYDAKQKGKTIKLRSDWEEVKYQIMYDIVLNKFSTNYDFESYAFRNRR